MAWPLPRSSFDQVSARTPLHNYFLVSKRDLVSCSKESYRLRSRTTNTAQETKDKHLGTGLSKTAGCIEYKVYQVSILQHRYPAVYFRQRCQYEWSLGIAKHEYRHNQLAHESFGYIEIIGNSGKSGCNHGG